MSDAVLDVVPSATALPKPYPQDVQDRVETIARETLSGMVADIDRKAVYPEQVLRDLGKVGAYAMHLPGYGPGAPSLRNAVEAMQCIGEQCLSNPMKTFYAIERLRLHGSKVPGGYKVRGLLPWVSNLGDGHCFGAIFEDRDVPERYVMAVIDCSDDAVKLSMDNAFTALDGTRTFAVQIRDLFIPDEMILADPIDDYLPKIRAGFVLLQSGMAFGIIESSIALMKQMAGSLGHVNKYLEEQPEAFEEELAAMREQVWTLCETPHETDLGYWRQVIQARLAAGEATVKAAHAAMLHCGARGYLENAEAQRRLREAYFVAIVTPATKQLRKMLAEMAH